MTDPQKNGQQTDMTSASPTAPVKDRATSLKETRKAKMDAAFQGKTFEIVKEVHLPKGQQFQTPFGNKGRHGYVLKNTASGEKFTIGATMLKQIAEIYQAVELPPVKDRAKAADKAVAQEPATTDAPAPVAAPEFSGA